MRLTCFMTARPLARLSGKYWRLCGFISWRKRLKLICDMTSGALPRAIETRLLAQFFVTEALDDMVIDQTDSLHERIADRRANELEAASPQVLAQRLCFLGQSGNFLLRHPLVLFRPDDLLCVHEIGRA